MKYEISRAVEDSIDRGLFGIIRARDMSLKRLKGSDFTPGAYLTIHGKGVSDYSAIFAKAMRLSVEQRRFCRRGGGWHDLGKIGVPDGILLKPGKLTEEEFDQFIIPHPQIGTVIAKKFFMHTETLGIIAYHHEDWDGGGYPHGLKGERIPLLARIARITDTLHTLTTKRPYAEISSYEEAVKIIKDCAGKEFDPNLIKFFDSKLLKRQYDFFLENPLSHFDDGAFC